MPADLAQEGDVFERIQPVGVVDHDRVGGTCVGAGTEAQEVLEDRLDVGDVGVDLLDREELAALVLARGVADLGGAAAHEDDRAVAGLLHPAQHHHRDQRSDMQAVGGRVVADIGGDDALGGLGVEPFQIGALVDVTALLKDAEEVGAELGHSRIWRIRRCAAAVSRRR